MKTADEFLEELKEFAIGQAILYKRSRGYAMGIGDAYRLVIDKIERFQLEQGKSNDNK